DLPAAGGIGHRFGHGLGVLDFLAVLVHDGVAAAGLGDLGVLERLALGVHGHVLAVDLRELGAVDRLALGIDNGVFLVELGLLGALNLLAIGVNELGEGVAGGLELPAGEVLAVEEDCPTVVLVSGEKGSSQDEEGEGQRDD